VSTAARSVCFLLAILAVQQSFAQSRAATLTVEPQTIQVDLFYSGAEVRVSGTSRAGEGLVLVCTGRESTVELNEKKKIWGLLWVNARTVAFHNVPSFYQVAFAKNLQDLTAKSSLSLAGIGFAALEANMEALADEDRRRCFPELIKLKEHEGSYSVREGSLEIQPCEGGRQRFSARFQFPSSVAPGEYQCRLIALDMEKPVTLAEQVISVQLAGTTAAIRSLSSEHGLLYGVLSVVIALAAGLMSGLIFGHRSGKGGH
jgi:hypothetical protein